MPNNNITAENEQTRANDVVMLEKAVERTKEGIEKLERFIEKYDLLKNRLALIDQDKDLFKKTVTKQVTKQIDDINLQLNDYQSLVEKRFQETNNATQQFSKEFLSKNDLLHKKLAQIELDIDSFRKEITEQFVSQTDSIKMQQNKYQDNTTKKLNENKQQIDELNSGQPFIKADIIKLQTDADEKYNNSNIKLSNIVKNTNSYIRKLRIDIEQTNDKLESSVKKIHKRQFFLWIFTTVIILYEIASFAVKYYIK